MKEEEVKFPNVTKIFIATAREMGIDIIPHIKDIYVNEKKRVVTVKYTDGTVSQATCDKDDTFDPYIGTCVALARRFCGSKVNLDHMIKKRTHIQG